MYRNGQKMSMCQIMAALSSQHICDMFTVSVPLSAGGTTFSLKFWKGENQEKMSAWGVLKSSCHRYLPGAAYYVSCQKRLYKIKYGL